MDIPSFIYSSFNGHLDCFWFWLLWIICLWIFVYKFFVWTCNFSFLGCIPSRVNSMPDCLINCQTMFQSGCLMLPQAAYESSSFSKFLPILVTLSLHHRPSGFEAVSHLDLVCAFLWWLMMLSIFSRAYWLFVPLLWRNVFSDLFSIF